MSKKSQLEELEEQFKYLDEEVKELKQEWAELGKRNKSIDKTCKSLDTGLTISKLLALAEGEYTPESFKKAQALLKFFRQHRRYAEDSHVYQIRLRKYEVALAKYHTAKKYLKEGGTKHDGNNTLDTE